ncbi:MAG: lysophospholipid acyltransferase family protein [Bacteroidota bacterium]|nr:lysophospholipid acyltransferase family protein [Bacteroidota bacterium]
MRYRIEFIFFQLFKWFVLALPLKSAQRLGAMLGVIAYYLSTSRQKIALENLSFAFPEKSEAERIAIAKGSFKNYGITLVELLWFPNLTGEIIRKLVKPQSLELFQNGYSAGKGMVLLAGHFGNWELNALGMAYVTNIPVSIIVQVQNNKFVDRVINQHRCLFGNKVIPMGISVREIIRTLQDGGVIGIAPDQSGDQKGGIYLDFFGRTVATHQGAAVFALRTRAPLIMGFIIRQADGTYNTVVEEILFADLINQTEENVIELTRRHLAILEKYIRQYPDHWLWMHRRWKHLKTTVDGENDI